MKRYRILEKYSTNDAPYYIVQTKRWYGWGIVPFKSGCHYLRCGDWYETFKTFEEAESALNKYLHAIKNTQRKSKVVKEYEK